jgi:hypothetical protein
VPVVPDPFPQTQAPYTAPTVYQPLPDNTSVYAAGEPSLDTTFRESAPRTEVLDQAGNLTNFDYTTGADLLSATGSGYSWTPPTVTSRPRSLMGTDQVNRLNQGRAAADLRQLSFQPGLSAAENEARFNSYAGLLDNPGSYSGGLSRSQIYARQQAEDFRRGALPPVVDDIGQSGTVQEYLAMFPDVGESFTSQKSSGALPANMTLNQFARNHYAKFGIDEMANEQRRQFTLLPQDAADVVPGLPGAAVPDDLAKFVTPAGVPDPYATNSSNWNLTDGALAEGMFGDVGPIYKAHGGSVKKPQGFADGGTATADLLEKTAGVPGIARNIYNYGKDVVTAPSPSAKLLADAMGVGMKATNDPVQYGAELLGFDDARQLAVMREAVAMTNELVDNGYLDKSSRVKLVGSTDDSSATRENVHIEGNEEVFNAVNHALFSYYAGQNPIAGLGAQIKEVKQGRQQIDRGNNPRTEYLDYFNNQFGLNLAKQGLSPEDAKYQIMANIGNIAGKGTRGRMQRGEEIKAGSDLLTNVQDATGVARYPWEKYAESVMDDADKLRAENPQGFADGGSASSEQTESRNILDRLTSTTPAGSLFITEDTAAEVNPDNIQRDIPRMEWDGVDRPTPMRPETESKNMLETLASGYPKAVSTVGNYFVQPDETTASQADMSLIPMGELASDTKALGGMLYEGIKEEGVVKFLAENLPVVAQVVAGRDMNEFTGLANEARAAGDSGLADMYEQIVVLSATGLIPGGAAANKTAKTTAIKAAKDAAKIKTESAEMLSTLTGETAPEAPTVAPEVGEAAQLLEEAESLRPEITTEIGARTRVEETGRYVGAPEGIDSPQKLAALTRAMTGLTKEGEFGRFWYERSGRQILDLTNGNKDDAEKLIQAIAITSANTPVAANFDFALQSFYQWKNGQPIKTGMYTTAMSKKLQKMFDGEEWAGRKTNNFYNNLMVEVDPSKVQGVTTDLWMMRAFGFDKDAPQPKEYDFVENETKRIAKNLGWEPQQVQAAIWVALKSRMENQGVKDVVEARSIENGWMHYETIKGKKVRVVDDQTQHAANWLGEAMKHTPTDADRKAAGFDYADAAQTNLGQISWESIPSRTSGHMPEIFEATPEVVQDYHVQMSKAFLDDKGNDVIAQQLEILSPGDFEAPGYFEGLVSPGTQTEITLPRAYGVTRRLAEIKDRAKANARPEEAAALGPTVEATSTGLAEPFVGPRAAAFEKDVLAADLREATYVTETAAREAMFAYAAVRGILLKQDGVGLHRPAFINGLSRPKANGIEVNIGRPLTADETSRVARAVAKEAGHTDYNPIGSPNGFRLINFGGMTNTEFQKVVNNALEKVTFEGGIPYNAKMFGADTGYLGNNWTENLNGEGYLDIGELAGRPDLQRKIRDIVTQLAPRVSAVEDEFAGRYNWTRNSGLNSSYETPQAQGIGSLPDTPLPAKRNKITFESFLMPGLGGSLGAAREKLNITPEKIKKYIALNKGTKQKPIPQVMAAAKKLKAGEISTQEYIQIAEEFQPIKPLGAVQKRPTNKAIAMALGKNEADSAGIVGVNIDIPDGTMISSRLDIPAYEFRDTWVVTLHDGTRKSGLAVGYGPTAVLNDVNFTTTSATAALNMATNDTNKGTIARINGSWQNRKPAEVEQLARDILSGKAPDADDWVEVGMNPFRHSYFYRKSDGMPVASAEEVIQVGPLVLARKAKTRPIESPEHLIKTPEGTPPTYFKKGGAIERVYNNPRYI